MFILPLQLAWNWKTIQKAELTQWVCFVPSMLLSVSLYAIVVLLLLVADNVVDTLLVFVAAQVLAHFSDEFVRRTLQRNRVAASLLAPYTLPFSGTSTILWFIS